MTIYKTGPHCTRPLDESIAWSKVSSIVKSVDSIQPFLVARSDAVRVFRHYMASQPYDRNGTDLANEVISSLNGYRHPKLYLEPYNEAAMDSKQFLAFVEQCHRAGYLVAGYPYTNAEGNYNSEQFAECRKNNWFGLDAISLHAYWDKGGPNNPAWEWHALSYRKCWQPGDPPILITECNMETIDGTTKDDLFNLVCSDTNLSYIQAFDAEISKDAEIIGATVFAVNTYEDFRQYDVAPRVNDLIEITNTGGSIVTQTLAELFPDQFQAWVAAGGDPEESFKSYLMGQNFIPATQELLDSMEDNLNSHLRELILAARRLPLA